MNRRDQESAVPYNGNGNSIKQKTQTTEDYPNLWRMDEMLIYYIHLNDHDHDTSNERESVSCVSLNSNCITIQFLLHLICTLTHKR